MNDTLIFQSLDVPPDISVVIGESNPFYIFQKKQGKDIIYFRIFKHFDSIKSLECDRKGEILNDTKLFNDVEFQGFNLNDYLWKVTECTYFDRFKQLEIIERIRNLKNELDQESLLIFLQKLNDNNSDSDD